MDKRIYNAPWATVVKLTVQSFMMVSGLEDYEDNPIFGSPAPEPDSIDEIIL